MHAFFLQETSTEERVSLIQDSGNCCYICFLDDLGSLTITSDDSYRTKAPPARRGSWCLQRHDDGNMDNAILLNTENEP